MKPRYRIDAIAETVTGLIYTPFAWTPTRENAAKIMQALDPDDQHRAFRLVSENPITVGRKPRKQNAAQKAQRRVTEQRQWIKDHGDDVAGYVERYGIPGDPTSRGGKGCYGKGGEAIYKADTDALQVMLGEAAKLGISA